MLNSDSADQLAAMGLTIVDFYLSVRFVCIVPCLIASPFITLSKKKQKMKCNHVGSTAISNYNK